MIPCPRRDSKTCQSSSRRWTVSNAIYIRSAALPRVLSFVCFVMELFVFRFISLGLTALGSKPIFPFHKTRVGPYEHQLSQLWQSQVWAMSNPLMREQGVLDATVRGPKRCRVFQKQRQAECLFFVEMIAEPQLSAELVDVLSSSIQDSIAILIL